MAPSSVTGHHRPTPAPRKACRLVAGAYRLALLALGLFVSAAAGAAPRTVVVGVFDNPPIVQQDGHGGYTGLSVDFLKSVARDNGWNLQYRFAPWNALLGALRAGEIDLLVGIAFNPARAKQFDFTRETLVNNYGIVLRRPDSSVTSVIDLRDKRVAMMTKSIHSRAFVRMMREFDIPFTPVDLTSYEAVLRALDRHEVDAGVVNRAMSILREDDHDVLPTGIIFNPVEVRYATPKGINSDLLIALDSAMRAQKHESGSAYQRAVTRWMGGPSGTRLPDWAPAVLGLTALVVLLLLVSNYLIRRRVAQRTAELSESEERFRQLAENIKDVFWIGSPDWHQVQYVSPSYETVWGMPVSRLYEQPLAWLDAVHPADRVAVEEALQPQVAGDFSGSPLPDFRITDGKGRTRWIQARAYPVYDAEGQLIKLAGLAEDITDRKAAEDTIRFMAYHDPLTRLHNRHAFEARLREAANRTGNGPHALMYVDLDQFKVLNDTCGHTAGDQMLQGLTAHLKRAISRDHILARLGGDEFGVLLENCELAEAERTAQALLDSVRSFRFSWEDRIFSVGASIGLVMITDDGQTLSNLLSAADIACYAAKDSGRNRIHVYREDDAHLRQRKDEMHWVGRLKEALENDGFALHAQPIVAVQPGVKERHCEFLLRMPGPGGELIPPGSFLPAAERFDLMPALDRWVISQVCSYVGRNPNQDETIAFVNLSGQTLTDDGFINHVLYELRRHGISPGSICLEITETAAIANLSKATRLIETLRQQGVLFALDDFGTGMSSFSYLKTLPVDFLKIDGFFIKGLLSDQMNPAIVEAITQIGHTAGLQVIAEWVEDDALLPRLRDLGIDFAQGYALGRPDALPPTPRVTAGAGAAP